MNIAPEQFKAPFISVQQAWTKADQCRRQYWASDKVPVEIEEILWKVGLRLDPIPSLKEAGDVDALLRGDLTTIIVDRNEYMDDRMLNRIRFSIAHELGHFVLHSEVYRGILHRSIEDWINFVQRVPEDQWRYMELHAYEFAGRLLVPADRLTNELKAAAREAEDAGFTAWDQSGDVAREYIANSLAPIFGVSSQVIEKRIIRENAWPPT